MGIYIKGLKAPASCCKCRMGRWSNYYQHYRCEVYDKEVAKFASKYNTSKPDWCPAIEVKEPHGRLIDADKMCADLATVDPQYETMIEWCIQVTNAQSAVIEGSENDES